MVKEDLGITTGDILLEGIMLRMLVASESMVRLGVASNRKRGLSSIAKQASLFTG